MEDPNYLNVQVHKLLIEFHDETEQVKNYTAEHRI